MYEIKEDLNQKQLENDSDSKKTDPMIKKIQKWLNNIGKLELLSYFYQ